MERRDQLYVLSASSSVSIQYEFGSPHIRSRSFQQQQDLIAAA